MPVIHWAVSVDRVKEILESEAESRPIQSGIGNRYKNGISIVNQGKKPWI